MRVWTRDPSPASPPTPFDLIPGDQMAVWVEPLTPTEQAELAAFRYFAQQHAAAFIVTHDRALRITVAVMRPGAAA